VRRDLAGFLLSPGRSDGTVSLLFLPAIGSSISVWPAMRLRPFLAEAGARFSWATLRRKASIRLTMWVREVSFGRSIRSPFCFLRRSSFSALSYSSSNFSRELALLAVNDVDGEVEHVLGDLFDLNYIEIVFCLANLVGTLERDGCFIRQPRRWAVPQPTKCGSGYEETKRTRLPPQAPTMRDHKVHLHSCRSGPS
jgi:hypothetical protein